MDEGTVVIVPLDGAQLRLFVGNEDVSASVVNVDAVLEMGDGSRWTATILSLAELTAVMNRWQESGENMAGRYFACPDLIVVRNGGPEHSGMKRAIHTATRSG